MATNASPNFGISRKIKQIGRTDLPGGGSVVVEDGYAYVGHIEPPLGTSIIDVSDPNTPGLLPRLRSPMGFTLTR